MTLSLQIKLVLFLMNFEVLEIEMIKDHKAKVSINIHTKCFLLYIVYS